MLHVQSNFSSWISFSFLFLSVLKHIKQKNKGPIGIMAPKIEVLGVGLKWA